MKLLQLTTRRSSFFNDQIRILEEKGIECDVISASKVTESSDSDGYLESLFFGHNPLYYLYRGSGFYPKILQSSIANDYDIVHSNNGLTAPFALAQPNRPLVMTFWGSAFRGERLLSQSDKLTNFCADRGDAVIVRDNAMRQMYDGDAYIITSGVDFEKFQPQDQLEAQNAVGWNSNDYHVVFPHNPEREIKNLDKAQRVVEEVDARMERNVVLDIVWREPHEMVPTYLNASDAMIVTQQIPGLPNTIKESMACDVPVVSTDPVAVQNVVKDVPQCHACSTEAEMVEKMVDVLRSGERPNSREVVQQFSLDRMGDRLIDVYKDVLPA